ncbi:MAG: choice-of-anchor J domain-containing protein, partial [Candidatus Margulisiibacteriota bacterium]
MKLSELIKIVCFQILLVGAMLSPVFAVTTPVINPIPYDIDGSYTVSWSAASSAAGIKNYILQESSSLEGCFSFSDGAEGGLVNWNSNNFTQSLAASSSGRFSFYSGNGNNLSNYLRTINPILVSSEAILKFKIKYSIESNYDYLRVQVSSNGNNWTTLESYSGTENSFVQKSISLASYEGQSIYLRFLYTTDSSVVYSGAYIDEIAVISYPSFASIGGNLTATFYNVTGKPTGRYYYQVKAIDNLDVQSRYSEIISVEVGPDITAPDAPNISASASSVVHGNSVGLTWDTPSDESSIVAYELQEKIFLPSSEASFQDNAEVGLSKWVNSGFSCSTARWHEGSYSFFSGSANNLNNTLTLRNPIHLESSPELSFWACYSLETYHDK